MEEKTKKRVAILGSTGSIGTQALEVIREQGEFFEVDVLTAHSNCDLLIRQAMEFKPNAVVIGDESKYKYVADALWDAGVKVYAGADALEQVMEMDSFEIALTAMVGFAGLRPTLRAIEYGKTIALANKETLVVAGDIVMQKAREKGVHIYPVDSEHSAIFQCLPGEFMNEIEKIYLTASGGPFRGIAKADLHGVTVEQALKHPNWSMGAKITIDSASMMNKGLEVIEAKWLFGLKPEQIDVVVHPQSVIHSIVQFEDGSMKAQMGIPDMKLPIQYALTFPHRLKNEFPRFNFMDYPNLSFEKPDRETFVNLQLAYDVLHRGGNAACALNAANEVTNRAFLERKITFLEIGDINAEVLQRYTFKQTPTLEDYFETDAQARQIADELIG